MGNFLLTKVFSGASGTQYNMTVYNSVNLDKDSKATGELNIGVVVWSWGQGRKLWGGIGFGNKRMVGQDIAMLNATGQVADGWAESATQVRQDN
jgi:hypothetical protein